ncbi:MAG: MnhB domain-containing protein [bacterium]|nr:MnhB domain-containing protein [bacterium]
MARMKPDDGKNWWPRLMRWIRDGATPLDDVMTSQYDEEADSSAHDAEMEQEALEIARYTGHDKSMEAEQRYLHALYDHRSRAAGKWGRRLYGLLAVLICTCLIVVLLQTASRLPSFGSASNPVNNEVSQRYIEKGMEETGAVNIVAGMILDYRAFDTLGESHVLFVAACTVLILLRITTQRDDDAAHQLELEADDRMFEPKNDVILQKVATLLVPFILLYGMYVILNGHISPGGGFSGGAVMGAALILYLNAFGFRRTERFFTFRTFKVVSCCALSFYAVSKAYSFFTGANHLHSVITPGTPGRIFSAGLIPYLNIAVGLVVCCTMYAFYTIFRKGDM